MMNTQSARLGLLLSLGLFVACGGRASGEEQGPNGADVSGSSQDPGGNTAPVDPPTSTGVGGSAGQTPATPPGSTGVGGTAGQPSYPPEEDWGDGGGCGAGPEDWGLGGTGVGGTGVGGTAGQPSHPPEEEGYGGGCGAGPEDWGVGGLGGTGVGGSDGGVGGTGPGPDPECVITASSNSACEYDTCLCNECLETECAYDLRACEAAGDPGCQEACVHGTEPSCSFTDCRNWLCENYCVEALDSGYDCQTTP